MQRIYGGESYSNIFSCFCREEELVSEKSEIIADGGVEGTSRQFFAKP